MNSSRQAIETTLTPDPATGEGTLPVSSLSPLTAEADKLRACPTTRSLPPSGPAPNGRERSHRRKTAQRQVILEELQAVTSHPTALELHQLVRRRLPRVSLGTVYRNLDLLTRMGVIEKLEHSGGEARFDANTAEHDHLRCVCCGRVDDVMTPPLDLARPEDHDLRGYEVIGHRLEYIGICPCCRQLSATKQGSAAGVTPGSLSTTSGESEHA
ncbi:MAG: transcriptional repressor [Thermoguttaceae bacterium]